MFLGEKQVYDTYVICECVESKLRRFSQPKVSTAGLKCRNGINAGGKAHSRAPST